MSALCQKQTTHQHRNLSRAQPSLFSGAAFAAAPPGRRRSRRSIRSERRVNTRDLRGPFLAVVMSLLLSLKGLNPGDEVKGSDGIRIAVKDARQVTGLLYRQ